MTPTRTLNLVVPAIIHSFGTICNFLAVLTLTRSQTLRGRIASIFLVTIFIADMTITFGNFLSLILSLLMPNITEQYRQDQIQKLNETNTIQIRCDPGDKMVILYCIFYASSVISYLTTTAFTIERVNAVYKPLKINHLNQNKRVVVITILSIIAISISAFMPLIFMDSYFVFNTDSNLLYWDSLYAEWCVWASLLFSVSIIVPSNILLIFKLRKENQVKRYVNPRIKMHKLYF